MEKRLFKIGPRRYLLVIYLPTYLLDRLPDRYYYSTALRLYVSGRLTRASLRLEIRQSSKSQTGRVRNGSYYVMNFSDSEVLPYFMIVWLLLCICRVMIRTKCSYNRHWKPQRRSKMEDTKTNQWGSLKISKTNYGG